MIIKFVIERAHYKQGEHSRVLLKISSPFGGHSLTYYLVPSNVPSRPSSVSLRETVLYQHPSFDFDSFQLNAERPQHFTWIQSNYVREVPVETNEQAQVLLEQEDIR